MRTILMVLLLAAAALAQGPYALQGVVKDQQTGEVLAGVNLRLEGTGLETASDEQGRFAFQR
jgi:hypothetical protein